MRGTSCTAVVAAAPAGQIFGKLSKNISLGAVMLAIAVLFFVGQLQAQDAQPASGFSAHEWGTFTSIASPDGIAMTWQPLSDRTDLPKFVEHLQGGNFKLNLAGKVRMETPVIYFYSAQERNVSVQVSFAKGLITEWYPHGTATIPRTRILNASTRLPNTDGSLRWPSVHIEPGATGDFATEGRPSHYYAARETSSTPIRVTSTTGGQAERFLFYRGVSEVDLPLSATVTREGMIEIENRDHGEIPNLILFERRGDKRGYRVLGRLRDKGSFALPTLSASQDSLSSDMEGELVTQGLYPDEAHAMVQTWKDSWFEEGARLFYIVPRQFVDAVLPLSIRPSPDTVVRVFVGRVELVTPETERSVETAFATGDRRKLAEYDRFLEPIVRAMIQSSSEPARTARLETYLNLIYSGMMQASAPSP
jgi:hypothetical protein